MTRCSCLIGNKTRFSGMKIAVRLYTLNVKLWSKTESKDNLKIDNNIATQATGYQLGKCMNSVNVWVNMLNSVVVPRVIFQDHWFRALYSSMFVIRTTALLNITLKSSLISAILFQYTNGVKVTFLKHRTLWS